MRESYFEELDDIQACLVEMSNSVGSAMSTATTALLDADVALADLVITGDERIDAVRESIEERCFTLLARQQPVATALRTITPAMRIVGDLGPRQRGGHRRDPAGALLRALRRPRRERRPPGRLPGDRREMKDPSAPHRSKASRGPQQRGRGPRGF